MFILQPLSEGPIQLFIALLLCQAPFPWTSHPLWNQTLPHSLYTSTTERITYLPCFQTGAHSFEKHGGGVSPVEKSPVENVRLP